MTKLVGTVVSTVTYSVVGALIAVGITVAPTEGTAVPGAGAPAIEATQGVVGIASPAFEAVKDVETHEVTGIAAPAFKAILK